MKQNTPLFFVLSIIGGASLWLAFLVGLNTEPWDTPYGVVAILVLGFLFGLSAPQKPWLWPLGLYLGQFLLGTFSLLRSIFAAGGGGANLFFPVGMIVLVFFCAPALATSLLGSFMRRFILGFKNGGNA